MPVVLAGGGSEVIRVIKCKGHCSCGACQRMNHEGFFVYGSNGKQGWGRYESVKMGPFVSREKAQKAGERVFSEFVE